MVKGMACSPTLRMPFSGLIFVENIQVDVGERWGRGGVSARNFEGVSIISD